MQIQANQFNNINEYPKCLADFHEYSDRLKDLNNTTSPFTSTYIHFTNIPKGILNDIGTEELAHLEIVGSIVYQLTKGDPIADLHEDLAAEQKARATYENLINLSDDPDVIDPLRFLREREVVHFQRFGEALDIIQRKLAEKKHYIKSTFELSLFLYIKISNTTGQVRSLKSVNYSIFSSYSNLFYLEVTENQSYL